MIEKDRKNRRLVRDTRGVDLPIFQLDSQVGSERQPLRGPAHLVREAVSTDGDVVCRGTVFCAIVVRVEEYRDAPGDPVSSRMNRRIPDREAARRAPSAQSARPGVLQDKGESVGAM